MTKQRNKMKQRRKKRHLQMITCISMLCTAALLISTILFARKASLAQQSKKKSDENLKKVEQEKEGIQSQLEDKEAYIQQWDGVYQQLAQQSDSQEEAEGTTIVENNDSPYQGLYPEMRVTTEDNKAAENQGKIVYLTFDDGPSQYTGQVLDALDVYGMKATFFVTYTDKPELQKYYKEIVDRGHTIAIHTASHEYKTIYASVENYLEDFNKIYQLVYEQTGIRPNLFRYPGGSTSLNSHDAGAAIAKEMESRGFVYFDWNVSSGDGSNRATEASVLESVTTGVAKFQTSVVLMHDTRQPTVQILPEVLRQLSETDARFESLDQNSKRVQFYDKNY